MDGRRELWRMVGDVQLRASSREDDNLQKKHLGCSVDVDPVASAAQTYIVYLYGRRSCLY